MFEYGKGIGDEKRVDSMHSSTFMWYLVGAKSCAVITKMNDNSHDINSLVGETGM